MNRHDEGHEMEPTTGTQVDIEVGDAQAAPSKGGRKAAIIVLVVIVVAIVLAIGAALVPKGRTLPADAAGFPAPELSGPKLDGDGTVSLADFRGSPVVVNFWASWCTTCKDEAPAMAAAEKKWRDQGVVFLGVDSVDKEDAARAFEKQYGMDYLSVFDPAGDAASTWRVTAYPETFFISPDGTIMEAVRTGLDAATIDAKITQLVQQ